MRMPRRPTLMMMLGGTLYLGPFLAGLSHQPGASVLVFGALLGLWSVLYQPGSWPRHAVELANPAVLARTMLLACLLLALAGIMFLAGIGLSYITGALPLPPAVPMAVTLGALALAMLVQSPRKAAEMDAFLDGALLQLQGLAASPVESRQAAMAEDLASRIAALPGEASAADVLVILQGSDELDAAFLAAVDRIGKPVPRPLRLAAVLLVTDIERGCGLAGRAEAAWVFDLARGDPELETLFAGRALDLLSQAPHLRHDMPYSCDVDQARTAASHRQAARNLADLRDRLNELSAPDA